MLSRNPDDDIHGRTGESHAGITQQNGYHLEIGAGAQGCGDGFGHLLAPGDFQLVPRAAGLGDVHHVKVGQGERMTQQRLGHLELVMGQTPQQAARRFMLLGLDIRGAQQFIQHIRHHPALLRGDLAGGQADNVRKPAGQKVARPRRGGSRRCGAEIFGHGDVTSCLEAAECPAGR
jgi:hypothetical protein